MTEEEWENYLKEYEQEYSKHLEERRKEIPNFMKLFERFDDEIYTPTKIYKLMRKAQKKLEKGLKLDKNQRNLLDKWAICEDIILNEMVEQAFSYAFSLGIGLKKESKELIKKYNLKN